MNQQILENRLIDFATEIIKLCGSLPKEYSAQHLGKQICRSATSSALHYGEVREAESTKDFIHKLKICLKELRETLINLRIIQNMGWIQKERMIRLLTENNELISIFVSTVKKMRMKIG